MVVRRSDARVQAETSSPARRKPARGTGAGLPRAEAAATLVLGGCSAAFGNLQLGVVTWSVGLLLTLNQLRAAQRLDAALAPVNKLAEVVDLAETCDVAQLRGLFDAYVSVTEREFEPLKSEVVAAAREELVRLRTEKTSAELGTGSYYHWLLPKLDATSRGQHLRALSRMLACEWDDSPVEQRFIEANVAAAERGVLVDRIFVMPRSLLATARDNPAVRQHFTDENPIGLRGHFVDADRLAQADRRLADKLGDGFIAFDEHVALIDLHSTDGSARGKVATRPTTLRELRTTFEELLVHSQPLSQELLEQARALPA